MNMGWMDTPWKVSNELWRMATHPWNRLLFFSHGIAWGRDWRFYGAPIIQRHRRSVMRFGSGLRLRSRVRSNPLGPVHPVILATRQAGARLEVGNDFAMTGGTLCAAERICIGDRVTVGANTTIIDTDFHPLDPAKRRSQPNDGNTAPVLIEDDVFIGMSCLILKGVTIGRGSVVGAGSVLTASVAAGSIVAGNPAVVLRRL